MSQSTRPKYKSLHWNMIRTPLIYSLINGLLHGHFSPRNCKIIILNFILWRDFSHSSVGKESACIAGLIPGSGRSSGEGIHYPLQYVWASLVAQLVKNLPAMWEAWVPSLVWEGTINLLYWMLYYGGNAILRKNLDSRTKIKIKNKHEYYYSYSCFFFDVIFLLFPMHAFNQFFNQGGYRMLWSFTLLLKTFSRLVLWYIFH